MLSNSALDFDNKICKLQSSIKDWTNDKIGNIKSQLITCRDYLDWIGKVEEVRGISQLEKWVKITIKRRYLELHVLEEDI